MRYDEIQNSENWDAEKMGIEKFWVSDITFLSAPSPPTSISVSFLSVASSLTLPEWRTFWMAPKIMLFIQAGN